MSTTNRRPNICDVCGRDNKGDEELCPWCFPPSEYANEPWTTQHGLDASGFLLLAEGHLQRARELVMKGDLSGIEGEARWAIVDAGNATRRALHLLKQKNERL